MNRKSSAIALALTFMVTVSSAANPSPFGLEIGVATCAAARAKLKASTERKIGDDIWIETANGEDLYPGASTVAARCSNDKVIVVQVTASKGGMGNDAAQQAYSTLSSKYKRTDGGPMPSVGNGFARFTSGDVVIEQSAPHMSFDFNVTYMQRSFYNMLKSANEEERKNTNNKKSSAL